MGKLRAVLHTGVGPNLIRSGVLSICWRHNLIPSDHLSRLGDANGRLILLLGIVVLRLRLGNSYLHAPLMFTKHLATTMIIGTEFLNRHGRAISCMEGVVETTRETVRILGRHRHKTLWKPMRINRHRVTNYRTLKRKTFTGVPLELHGRF